ncbi:MAG: hypothetical protein R3C59_28435 [Planctomycetaceae bacterium]
MMDRIATLTGALAGCLAAATVCADDSEIMLRPQATDRLVTNVEYSLTITGEIATPSDVGPQRFPLKSRGEFRFQNDSTAAAVSRDATALRAVRKFKSAATQTTVGTDHTTQVELSAAYRTIFVVGSDKGLVQWSPGYALSRQQLDLLQMPFDVLTTASLLPTTPLAVGEKWNADAWLIAALTGIEVAVEQSATCELISATSDKAIVALAGTIKGGVQGSTSDVSFDGRMIVDRATGVIESFTGTQKEKRSPGPVSPGLDVTAVIQWRQTEAKDQDQDAGQPVEKLPDGQPAAAQLQLVLQTPLKLQLRHSREWYLFHETSAVLMLRQLRDGSMISQCNLSAAVTVPPGQFTPDREFLSDVTDALRDRHARVVREQTVREDGQWRIRHVQAEGVAADKRIVWDYYLCAAATGEQFSIVFSHAKDDADQFKDEASRVLATLQIVRRRPALPFR